VNEPKGIWIDELRSEPTKQPLRLDIGPARRKGEREGRAQAAKASDIVAVDENVLLQEGE
jgi:hypothetical protein